MFLKDLNHTVTVVNAYIFVVYWIIFLACHPDLFRNVPHKLKILDFQDHMTQDMEWSTRGRGREEVHGVHPVHPGLATCHLTTGLEEIKPLKTYKIEGDF